MARLAAFGRISPYSAKTSAPTMHQRPIISSIIYNNEYLSKHRLLSTLSKHGIKHPQVMAFTWPKPEVMCFFIFLGICSLGSGMCWDGHSYKIQSQLVGFYCRRPQSCVLLSARFSWPSSPRFVHSASCARAASSSFSNIPTQMVTVVAALTVI